MKESERLAELVIYFQDVPKMAQEEYDAVNRFGKEQEK